MSKITLTLGTVLVIVAIAGWGLALRSGPSPAPRAAPGDSTVRTGTPAREPAPAIRPAAQPGSIAAVVVTSGAFEQRAALYRLATSAAPKRLRKLIEEAIALDDVNHRRDFLHILFSRLAQDDPGDAIRLLLKSNLPGERAGILQAIFYDWARRDTDAALQELAELDDPHLVQAAGDGIMLAHARPGRLVDNQLLGRMPMSYNPGPALGWYLGAQAARDPRAAAIQAAGLYDQVLRRAALHAVADAWARQDPAAALAFAETLSDSRSRWHFEHPVIERWMASDVDGLLAAIESLPDHKQRVRLLRSAMRELVARDPQRAVEYAATADIGHASQVLNEVLSEWARQDFAAALATAEARLTGSQRGQALHWMVKNYAATDPGAALAWALGYDGGTHLASAVNGAAGTDSETAVAFLMSLDPAPFPAREWQSVVASIARHRPDLAVTMLDRVPEQHRAGATRQIAVSLAERDIQAALEWTNTLDGRHRNHALNAVVQAWAQRDVEAAAVYAADSGKPELIGAVAHAYARHDHRAAYEWLLATSPDSGQMQTIIQVWAEKDPAAAAAVVAQHTGKPWARRALTSVAQAWISTSPGAAAAWLTTLPDNDSTAQAIQFAARNLASQSPDVARRWVEQLSGASRDSALVGLLTTGQLPPDGARALANSIENSDQRYRAFQVLLYRSAGGNSTDTGQEFLAGADLTPGQRQRLLDEYRRAQKKGY